MACNRHVGVSDLGDYIGYCIEIHIFEMEGVQGPKGRKEIEQDKSPIQTGP